MTMNGGGFAAIPAYLADLFGTGFVGATHGRLLTGFLLFVTIPMGWGLWATIRQAALVFW